MARTIIDNKPISIKSYLALIIAHRRLIVTFVKRDLKSKYAQTKLGMLWMVIQPITVLVIFTVLFDQLIHIDTADVPYPVFAFSGMIIWYLFTNIVQSAGNSLIASQDLMKKVYFPKLILPISKTLVALIELMVSALILAVIMLLFEVPLTWKFILIPIPIILITFFGFCIALWLNAFSIKRRDLQHFIPHIINTGIWLTPVFYPTSIIPEKYLSLMYFLNPVATVIEMFRAILFNLAFDWTYCFSFVPIFVLLIFGLIQFKRVERDLTDFI